MWMLLGLTSVFAGAPALVSAPLCLLGKSVKLSGRAEHDIARAAHSGV